MQGNRIEETLQLLCHTGVRIEQYPPVFITAISVGAIGSFIQFDAQSQNRPDRTLIIGFVKHVDLAHCGLIACYMFAPFPHILTPSAKLHLQQCIGEGMQNRGNG